ncbi:hypothetical protein [Halobellus rufus]|uniref:hypothetical protein n=1 Tax=Halobellus rufus TaxID=1448860 RepID=UPI0006792DFB|nr:hypothetical protein [Halobellus rufus]
MQRPTLQRLTVGAQERLTGATTALIGGTLFAVIGLSVVLGPLGSLVALSGLVVGVRGSGVLGILLLHVGAILTPEPFPLWAIGFLEAASILFLAADFRTLRQWRALFGVGGLVAVGSSGIFLLVQTNGIILATVGVAATAGVLLYLGHRYEQLSLGLLTADQ